MREETARQIALEIETHFPHIKVCVVSAKERSISSWIIGLFHKETNASLNVVIDSRSEYHHYLCAYRAFASLPNEMFPVEAELEKQFQEEIASWSKK